MGQADLDHYLVRGIRDRVISLEKAKLQEFLSKFKSTMVFYKLAITGEYCQIMMYGAVREAAANPLKLEVKGRSHSMFPPAEQKLDQIDPLAKDMTRSDDAENNKTNNNNDLQKLDLASPNSSI